MDKQEYVEKAETFKVLSDANRLQIIDMLSCGEMCVCKILEKFNITQPTLSHHLKVLARKMAGLAAKVTCAARKDEDLAWIRAYGHNETNINTIGENLGEFDIIINTVPHLILNKERLQHVKKECLLIDLASNPGGIDKKEAKERNLKLIWALALPRKSCTCYNSRIYKRHNL